mgnify:FL=1
MPRPAVGVRPSTSFYAPAVPRGLRLCREGCGEFAFFIRAVRRGVGRSNFRTPAVPRGLRLCRVGCGGLAFYIRDVRRRVGRSDFRAPTVPRGLRLCREGFVGHAFYIRAVRRRVGRSDFRAPAVPRGLRLCRGGCGGLAFYIRDGRRKGRSFFIHYVKFFQMSTLIRLRRTAHLPGGTEGVLFFPAESGQSPMATLEPPASGAHPAIPAGEYPLSLDVVSPRFARSPRRWSAAWGARLPRLMQVPGREGILIHPGNRPADSSGCVLIGRAVSPLRLGESVATFHRLMYVLHRLPPPLRIRVED